MAKRKKRTFTSEFKADVVRLCLAGDRSITQVAKDLDLTESALRAWVARTKADANQSPTDVLTSTERQELQQLRRDVKRLQMERDILKKAAAFFVRENA